MKFFFIISSSKTLSYSWNGFYVRHFLSIYSTILYLKPLISHVKLSKSFMKIELYYIHISYLSQCVTFKHPSKLVKHKLPCKNHVRNTATLSLPASSVANISQLSLQSILNIQDYCSLACLSPELLSSPQLSSYSKGLHGCHTIFTHESFFSLIGL